MKRILILGAVLAVGLGGAAVVMAALPTKDTTTLDPGAPGSTADVSRPLATAAIDGASFVVAPAVSDPAGPDAAVVLCMRVEFAGESVETCGPRTGMLQDGVVLKYQADNGGTQTLFGRAPSGTETAELGGNRTAVRAGFFKATGPGDAASISFAGTGTDTKVIRLTQSVGPTP